MKTLNFAGALFILISTPAFAQDTSDTSMTQRQPVTIEARPSTIRSDKNMILARPMKREKKESPYRPTRLGSSSAPYNTYEKNKNGAGAITTNPNKAAGTGTMGTPAPAEVLADSLYRHSTDSSYRQQ